MPPGVRDQVAARRGASQANPASSSRKGNPPVGSAGGDGLLEDRTVSSQVKRAARSGQSISIAWLKADKGVGKLDISSFSLQRIPVQVYTDLLGLDANSLSHPSQSQPGLDEEGVAGSFKSQLTITDESGNPFGSRETKREEWVEPEELTGFKALENEIRELDVEVGAFGGLKSIDVSGF